MTSGSNRMPDTAIAALERGDLIAAARHVRAATGLGLKESKQLVQSHLRSDELLNERYRAAKPATHPIGLLVVALLIIASWFIYSQVMGGR